MISACIPFAECIAPDECMSFDGFRVDLAGLPVTDFTAPAEESATELADGSTQRTTLWTGSGSGLQVRLCRITYPDTRVCAQWLEATNVASYPLTLTRVDSYCTAIPAGEYRLRYFTSGWGREFTPVDEPLCGTRILESTAGRSSQRMYPWFALTSERSPDPCLAVTVAWSGNWVCRFEPLPGGAYRLSGGLSDWQFFKTLFPGETMISPRVLYVYLHEGDVDDAAREFGRWGLRYGYPRNELARALPVEWNHWWPYEDVLIDEETFRRNVDVCAELGFEVCTLDAGWFGTPGDDPLQGFWYGVRGDWEQINRRQFPSSLRVLADYVHGKGLKFGVWCEIEALAPTSAAAQTHPDLVARRDGEPLGYLCLGNPQAQDWAYSVLERLIVEYEANWIKLDFNLDPQAGCNEISHGHESGDGLYAHYLGYYALLDRLRARYPHVLLESCSSGGLRIDLEMLQHLHLAFLSDPDYTVHHLQVVWGATHMLHPSACLHWAWSQTRGDHNVEREPVRADTPPGRFDYMVRAAMLTATGFSYRLPDLPDWARRRLGEHIAFYKQQVRPFVRDADLYHLSGQALRDGGGDRWNAFLYVRDAGAEALLFVFRLPGGEERRVAPLRGLIAGATYAVQFVDRGETMACSAAELTETGLAFDGLSEEGSEVVLLRRM